MVTSHSRKTYVLVSCIVFCITRRDTYSSISKICEVQNFTRALDKEGHTGLNIRSAKSRTLKINDGLFSRRQYNRSVL